jgi:hypothetical protein
LETDVSATGRKQFLVEAIGFSHPAFEQIAVNGFLEEFLGRNHHDLVSCSSFRRKRVEGIFCKNRI